jgi:hypothetical protein
MLMAAIDPILVARDGLGEELTRVDKLVRDQARDDAVLPPPDDGARSWRSSNIMLTISWVRLRSGTAFIRVVAKQSLLQGAIAMVMKSP